MCFHPHLHCIVTGGGLAPDGEVWVPLNRRFIFPVRVLGDLFRGKFLDGLRRLRRDGSLRFTGGAANVADDDAFDRLLGRLYQTAWVVYAKRPFAGVEHVFRYLGRYTHRVGISNHRIQAFDDEGVRFATKNGKAVTVEPFEFIRRFLDHVLPAGFTKIRHFGLLASGNVNTKLEKARSLLTPRATEHGKAEPTAAADGDQSHAAAPVPTWQELLLRLTGIDPSRCPECGAVLIYKPLPTSRPSYEDTS